MKSRILLFAVLLLGTMFQVQAQVTSSSMSGTVRSEAGEPLVGAIVEVKHTPSGTEYFTTALDDGRFFIPNMRVGGPYEIRTTYIGFSAGLLNDIYLSLGKDFGVTITLQEGVDLEGIDVVAFGGSTLNSDKTGAATSVNAQQLMTLPTVSRSIADFTRLTPQSNGNSFAGRDGRYNNFQVDGANFNNGFGLNDNPLPGGGGLSIDAIEEIQVNIAPFDVRQSGFSGAGINAITRSGTNTFTGSAYGFFSNQDFQGSQVGDITVTRPISQNRTLGFRLGGPIIKNKLFFFVNAEQIKRSGAGVGAVNLWQASEDGVADQDQNITRVRRSDLEAVRNHLINRWGYDPGAYENYANDNSETTNSILARIDWNINRNNRLAIRYNQVTSSAPSLTNANSGANPRTPFASHSRVGLNSISFENSMYFTENIVRSITAELNTTINSRLSNQFLATFSRIQATRTSRSEEFPFIDIGFAGDSLRNAGNTYLNYISAGYELFSFGNDVLNDNYSIVNNLNYSLGKHYITVGASFEMQKFGNRYLRNGTSYYRYASVEEFLATGTPQEVAPLQFAVTYPYEGQDLYAPILYGLPSLYIQDRFEVSNSFTLTAGIRAEMPIFLNDLTANASVDTLNLLNIAGEQVNYSTASWPKTRIMLSPRVGFRWDASENSSLIVRGGTGIFAGRVPFVWLTNMPSNLGVIQNTVEPGSYDASSAWIGDIRFNPDKYHWTNNPPASAADVFIPNATGGLPGTVAIVDENFKMPQLWRSNLGVDYRLRGTPFTLSADFMYSKDLQAVYQFGANRKPAAANMNYSGDNREYYPNPASYTYNSVIGGNSVSVLSNTTLGDSYNATIGLTMEPRKGFYFSFFYSHTSANTTTDNLGSNALSAWGATPNINNPNDLLLASSIDALPHRVVGVLSYQIGGRDNSLGTTVSLFYNGANQGRFSYTYNGDMNGDAINADLLYIPANASDLTFAPLTVGDITYSPEDQAAVLQRYIDSNEFLNSNKGDYAPRNGGLLPWLNRFDFKILHDIYLIPGTNHRLQLSLDFINVGNLLNSNWGIRQQINPGATTPLRVVSNTDGVPTFQMNTITVNGETVLPNENLFRNFTTTATTWSMLAGVRYIF